MSSRLTRDGTAETVSRDQILRNERGQGNINFPCSADHEQDWQPFPVDPYSCYMCDRTYIHAGAPIAARVFFVFVLKMPLFRVFFVPFPLSLCMESTSYVLSFRVVFFYLVTTGWIFDIS